MTPEDNPARTVPEHRTPLRRFWPAAPAVIAAGCLGWWFWPSTPPLNELPQPNTTLVSPDVRELMTTTRQSVVDSPNSADAWGQLGMVLLAYEFDRDSVPCFQNASALDPEEFRWHYCLGLALTAINRDAATEAFEKALSVSPKDPWTLARLGELKLAEGKIPEAKAFLTKAVAASSRPSARTRQALARTLLASGEFDSALAEATKAVEAAPDSRMALEVLAQAQHRLSNPDASKTLARMQTLPDRPLPWEDPHAGYVLAQRLMASNAEDRMLQAIRSGDIRGAIESGERALQSQPENQAVALRLSELYAETGLQDRAVAILQEEIRRHPSQAELHFRLGVVTTLQDNWAQADQHFLEAAKLAPDYVLAWHNHGQCLMKLEKFSEAVTAFEEAVRLAPEQKTSRIHLTRLLLKENRTTEAEKHLRILEVQAPEDAEVVELRGTFSKTTNTESTP
ncbi:MAG: tetratricopeptide repeat protein [Planctomycetaceae bacterium]